MVERLVWLAPALPMLAALWIAIGYATGANRGEPGERRTAVAATLATGLAVLVLLAIDVQALILGAPGQVAIWPWLTSGRYEVWISFTLDGLGLGLGTLVALITFLAVRFSASYMHREAGFQRFFIVLSLFAGAMQLIVLAGNAVLAFVGWELAGVSSYLLIAYAYDRPVATENATRVFVTNRVGDAGFVFGIFLAFAALGGIEWPVLTEGAGRLDGLTAGLIGTGFLLAALVKSAQVPFAPWIGRALEGPTPSSAVFYGSLMVHAGVYLVIRLAPLYEQAPVLLGLMGFIGLLTALYGFLGGLTQTDVKSSLMFSTTGQVGLMFCLCGLGWFGLAAWYLALHAVWRAYQFLSAPSLLYQMNAPARPAPAWLRRSRRLYTASLQRFWLDPLADALLARPTRAMARDVATFDDEIVQRLAGDPGAQSVISSLAEWEAAKGSGRPGVAGAHGRGLPGRLLAWLAGLFDALEARLVMRGGATRMQDQLREATRYLLQIDQLLSQPRYLLLMIMATFVVIL